MCNYIIGLKVAGKDELEQRKAGFGFEDAMDAAHELSDFSAHTNVADSFCSFL